MTLRDYRKSRDLSQFDFAVLAGVTPGTIANIERGKGCTAATAQAVIRASGGEVTLDDLVVSEAREEDDQANGPSDAGA